jgi:hypothetical protein
MKERTMNRVRITPFCLILIAASAQGAEPVLIEQTPNTWVKRSPLKDGPPSPGMGYECALGYDPVSKLLIRWAGHNQGGGGEQNAETWVYDTVTRKWALREPNTSPPGVCCAQQNVVDPIGGRYLRFQAFSGSHGWQWFREIYMSNSAVWSYDAATNTWRDMRPLPAPRLASLRCASWDSACQVVVIFGGEGSQEGTLTYDSYTNTFTKMNPKVQPAPRSGGNMAYDEANKVHVLFGSQFEDDPRTWVYDLKKNEWRDMQPKTQPPTDRNDAVLAYDRAGKVVIALVRVIDKTAGKEVTAGHLETWAYDMAKNEWKRMNPGREPDGWCNRRRVMVAVPDQNLILAEVYLNPTDRSPDAEREQQIWTYRHSKEAVKLEAPKRIRAATQPALVEDALVSTISPKEIRLSWKAVFDASGYHIERAPMEVFAEDQIIRLKKDTEPLKEPSVGGVKAIGAFRRLTKEPLKQTEFIDADVDLTKSESAGKSPIVQHRFRDDQLDPQGKGYRFGVYAYRIRAVNAQGEESGPSPYFLTIPSSPRWVYSKEVGESCELKWSANPEAGIKGYRVYRMEGPKINGPGQKVTRLNEEPIKETKFIDKEAGKETKRYWIVAVDALGQEGYPSAPVWHYRQFRKFYEPFVGEWHQ